MVAPLTFAFQIASCANVEEYTRDTALLLCRYEREIRDKGIEELYFPLHVNGNHWIACLIDFRRGVISYGLGLLTLPQGDPLGYGIPKLFRESLQKWLRTQFHGKYTVDGNTLPHGEQTDAYSCGVIVANTILHAIKQTPLWGQGRSTLERLRWFTRLSIAANMSPLRSQTVPLDTAVTTISAESNVIIALGDHNFDDLPSFAAATEPDIISSSSSVEPLHHFPRRTIYDLLNPEIELVNDNHEMSPLLDCEEDLAFFEMEELGVEDVLDNPSIFEDEPAPTSITTPSKIDYDDPTGSSKTSSKRKRRDSNETTEFVDDHGCAKKTSRSAQASLKLRQELRTGELKVDNTRYEQWQQKLRKADPHVTFYPNDIRKARHSVCGTIVTMGTPYETGRWSTHLNKCASGEGKRRASARAVHRPV
ncbi:hypothetical protein H0H93_004242 [Arthromyces matolae]|nr:hypothetical protein H0H93_004242 [Arthromyces matolae]